jgi:hypothetical protein
MKLTSLPLSNKKIRIHFSDENNTDNIILTYHLYESQILERWWSLLDLSEFTKGKFGATNFAGQLLDDEEYLVTTLNYFILKINTFVLQNHMPEFEIPYTIEKGVSQKILNDIHRFFEINAHDPRLKEPLKNTFRLLNLFIHRMENFSDHKKNDCVLIEIAPADWRYLPLCENDFSLFDLDWKWGQLLLNYCHLGVPTAQAYLNKSIPKPQSCFSAGMYLSFVDDSPFIITDELNSWLIQNGLDPMDPKCALGYIPLGILVEPEIPQIQSERIQFLLKFKKCNKLKKIELLGEQSFIKISPTQQIPTANIK